MSVPFVHHCSEASHTHRLGDSVAGIIGLHDVSGRTVFARVAEADCAGGLEVGACRVDYALVNGCQLVAVYRILNNVR